MVAPDHDVFPLTQRQRAVELLCLGYRLRKRGWGDGVEEMAGLGGLFDVWVDQIMPLAIGCRCEL